MKTSKTLKPSLKSRNPLSIGMHSKKIRVGSRDLISDLPDDLICRILSFVPTKEAASTSVLSKRWKNLLAFVPNLEFDDSIYLHPRRNDRSTRFKAFVSSVLALQRNHPLNRFYFKCDEEDIEPIKVYEWLPDVLKRGVLDLHLYITSSWYDFGDEYYFPLPEEMFVSKSLMSLKIGVTAGVSISVENVSLPKLRTLDLDHVSMENSMFSNLLAGCHELHEVIVTNLMWKSSEPFSVSSITLKRLTLCRNPGDADDVYNESVSFDTPNLIYLEYSDVTAVKYPKASFDSLVEATLDLRLTDKQIKRIMYPEDVEAEPEGEMKIGDATDFLMGISKVKILYLSNDTLEVLKYRCVTMPVFNNLIQLTIKTHEEAGWKSLPALLKNCPILDTLIFEGLHHKPTNTCREEDGCLCKYQEEYVEVPTCLSSSPVKVLKILKFGENLGGDDIKKQIKQMKYFLETMPNLDRMILYYDTKIAEDVIKVSSQLQMVASSKCKIQVISKITSA